MKLFRKIAAIAAALTTAVSAMAVSASADSSASTGYYYPSHNAPGSISSWQADGFYSSGNVKIGRTEDYNYTGLNVQLTLIRGYNSSTVTRHMIIQGKMSDNLTDPVKDDTLFSGYQSCEVGANSWSTSYMPKHAENGLKQIRVISSATLYNNAGTTMGGINSSVKRTDIIIW